MMQTAHQHEFTESGKIDLSLIAERIQELKTRKENIEEIQPPKAIPIRLYTDESITAFQETIKKLFSGGEDRVLTKRYFKLFIDKIIINLLPFWQFYKQKQLKLLTAVDSRLTIFSVS